MQVFEPWVVAPTYVWVTSSLYACVTSGFSQVKLLWNY